MQVPIPAPPAPTAPRGRPARRRTRAPLWACYLAVLSSVAAVAALGPVPARQGLLLGALVSGGIAWWGACAIARRAAPRWGAVAAGALLLRAVALVANPGLSDDVHRYVWEAEVVLFGASPYALAPDSPELEGLRAERPALYGELAHKDVAAAYPPLFQGAALAAVGAARALSSGGEASTERAVLALRILSALADLGALAALALLLGRLGLPPGLALVWGWSPLVALEFAGSGHLDSVGIALWIAALFALVPAGRASAAQGARARWREIAGLALLAGAILVKYLPACSLPFALRDRRCLPRAALVLSLCALAFAPFLLLRGGTHVVGGLADYGLRWESASLIYRFVEPPLARLTERDGSLFDPRRLGRALVLALWLGVGAVLWVRRADLVRASFAMTGAFLVLSPTLHPWYLAWIVPFLAVRGSRAWSFLVAAMPLAYWPLDRWQREGVWFEPAWSWPLIGLPFLGLLLVELCAPRALAPPARHP